MNRKIVLFIIVLLPGILFADNFTLSLSNLSKSWKVSFLSDSSYMKYGFTVKRNDEGRYYLTAAPFAAIQYKGFRFGELKFANIAQILTTSDNMYATADFISGRIRNVYMPSESPKFSGFSYSGKNFDVFALSPTINPNGPAGVGGVVHIKNLGLGAVVLDYGKEIEKYGKRFCNVVISADSSFKNDLFNFSSSSFVRTSVGKNFGVTHETGSDVLLKNSNYLLYASFRHSNSSEKAEIVRFKAATYQDMCSYGIFFSSQLGTIPVYGGESQRKDVLLEFFSSLYRLNLKSSSEIEYTKAGKINAKTTYTAIYSLNNSAITAQISHNRQEDEIGSWNIQFTDSRCRLRLKDGKLTLTYRFVFPIGKARIRFLISQDKTFTVSARMTT